MREFSHLDPLEAEAIYIMREVAAECERPVMLYSIGKDSSVMLHLAMKAFYPEKPPFPFLHVDTTWKFKEMIDFRDRKAKELGIDMLVYTNQDGIAKGINPFDHGAAYTDIMKTQALKQALQKYGFTAAFGGGRRDLLVSAETPLIDPAAIRVPTLVIGGDKDPYLNLDSMRAAMSKLPSGSKLEIMPGAAHAMMMEKPYCKEFRQKVVELLEH